MTAFEVDLDQLRSAVRELSSCQRDILGLAADLDQAQVRIQTGWLGLASTAQESSYETWRAGCAEMVTALADLRAIALAADSHYSHAVESNVARWRQVSA